MTDGQTAGTHDATARPGPGGAGAPEIDMEYVLRMLRELLEVPSPAGFTDNIVHFTCAELTRLGVEHELTRRGAIRANLKGRHSSPDRAVVGHVDTLGAMVKYPKTNGRLEVVPIGTWSARFAEGCRVTVYCDNDTYRGTILPLKASGHVYNEEVDTQPTSWANLELRLDEIVADREGLNDLGINVGDFISIDPTPEFSDNGFINSRHLDDKAGVAAMLGAIKAITENGCELPVDCHMIFTVAEEVGLGVPGTLHSDIAEMIAVDNGTIASGQNTSEFGVTICAQDSSGPFDYHLVRKLFGLCDDFGIEYSRDVFNHYRSDGAAAVESGSDLRTCLVCFALDSSHGYERTHADSLKSLAQLLVAYMESEPTFLRDKDELGPIDGFPHQPE